MTTIADLRKYRVAGMAIFDWLATLVGAFIIGRVLKKNIVAVFLVLIILAIVIHLAVGVPTMLNVHLGLVDQATYDAAQKL